MPVKNTEHMTTTMANSRTGRLKHPAGWAIAALGLLAGTPGAMAACNPHPGFKTNIPPLNMTVGRVFISPNDPVGTIYPSNSPTDGYMFPVNPQTDVAPFICPGGGLLLGKVLSGGTQIDSDKWFTTSVEGIAIQLSRNRAGNFISYPHTIPFFDTAIEGMAPFQSDLKFVVRLKKIARVTGSGPLAPGIYSTYTSDGSATSVLTTQVIGNAITIVTPTCTVDAGSKVINVPLGKQPRSTFTGINSTSPAQPFSIRLNCNAGVGSPLNQVYLRMDSNNAVPGTPGLLKLTPGGATGVGIQVRDEKAAPVVFGGSGMFVGQSKDGAFDVRFTARYIQTADKSTPIKTGIANSTATFTIDYK